MVNGSPRASGKTQIPRCPMLKYPSNFSDRSTSQPVQRSMSSFQSDRFSVHTNNGERTSRLFLKRRRQHLYVADVHCKVKVNCSEAGLVTPNALEYQIQQVGYGVVNIAESSHCWALETCHVVALLVGNDLRHVTMSCCQWQ